MASAGPPARPSFRRWDWSGPDVNTARTLLPAVLLLYFLWRSMRQRIFLLGLPFLMDMYFSIFFDRLKLFWVPVQLNQPAAYMMLWLFVTWVIYFDLLLPRHRRSVREHRLFGPRLSLPEEIILLGLAAYVGVEIALTAVKYMDLGSALGTAAPFLYLIGGYFLLRGMVCHAGRRETVDFVGAVVVVNAITCVAYVLNQGFHMAVIYGGLQVYQSIVFNGQNLTRSFYFMPQFLPLAVAYCVAKPKWGVFWTTILLVTLAAVWVSYTRALVIVVLVEIAVVLGVRLLKRRDAWPAFKRMLQVAVIGAVFVAAVFALLPTSSSYFLSRFAETSSHGSVLRDTDLQVRLAEWRTTYDWVGSDRILLGVGFPSPAQDARVNMVGVMAPDVVWVPTVWSLGLIGVACLACLFAVFALRAFKLSISSEGDAAFIAVTLLGVIVGAFLQGFVQWTILDPWHTPIALWFFALLVAERWRQTSEAHQVSSSLSEMRPMVSGAAGS